MPLTCPNCGHDLSSTRDKRATYLTGAVDKILAKACKPLTTTELAEALSEATGDAKGALAQELLTLLRYHPAKRPTGETFRMFGRSMPRYVWRADTAEDLLS